MGLSFLAPVILGGLLALAVPVWVHLTHRRRKDVVEFPSLMFLRKIPYREVRRSRIRHWLLLAARCLALVLLVAAFARPVIDGPAAVAGAVDESREVVVLLDRSYSMAYGDRWTRAVEAVRRRLESLGPDDRASLILFDQGADAVVRSSTDRSRLRAALDSARAGSGATRFGPALRLAGTILEDSDLASREAVLVSDFQKEGWSGAADLRLPERAVLTPVPVGEDETSDALVSAVSFRRERASGGERVVATARITNRGSRTLEELPVTLEVGAQEIETVPVTVEAGATAGVTFSPFALGDDELRGAVRIGPDALPVDDVRRFVLSSGQALGVLVLESGRRNGQSLFLARALELGREPAFDVAVKRVTAFRPADLEGRAVVILNDAPLPGGAGVGGLLSFVESGGGLLVALGEASAFPSAAHPLLPGRVGEPVDRREGRGGVLSRLEYAHPVFEIFRTPRSGDFTGARFFRYRRLTLDEGAAGAGAADPSEGDAGPDVAGEPSSQVLASFDDGAPALVEKDMGEGRVLVWTSTLDDFWNDLVLQPVYLPFVHQAVRHLAGWRAPVPWLTVGQTLSMGADGGSPEEGSSTGTGNRLEAVVGLRDWEGGARVARSPSGRILPLPAVDRGGFLDLDEDGFWEIRTPGPDARRLATLAVNPDPDESRLESLDPEELARSVAGPSGGEYAGPGPGGPGLALEDRERRQALWRYLLLAALLVLTAETVGSNLISKTGTAKVT